MDVPKMIDTKQKTVNALTSGIEYLFKKNGVTYIKGHGKITGKNEVSVTGPDGKLVEKVNSKNIVIATGSDASKFIFFNKKAPLPGVAVNLFIFFILKSLTKKLSFLPLEL
jgi:pyruvate/2-oxoglutarate dehydrogenase complex dihydrolipoamide dehydrogenase (E3) component